LKDFKNLSANPLKKRPRKDFKKENSFSKKRINEKTLKDFILNLKDFSKIFQQNKR
jgi:hypothetical protein